LAGFLRRLVFNFQEWKMLIEVADLKLSIHANPVLNGVRLTMQEGEIYGLLGPNGAGKSTTLSVLTGLRAADSGKVKVMGLAPVRQKRELHGKLGVLAEDSGFYGWMSAHGYLHWMARLYGRELSAHEMARRLEQVGLSAANRQAIKTYSRGMKQRMGLARALLNDPQLLILDEPTQRARPARPARDPRRVAGIESRARRGHPAMHASFWTTLTACAVALALSTRVKPCSKGGWPNCWRKRPAPTVTVCGWLRPAPRQARYRRG